MEVVRVIDNIKKSNNDPWNYRGIELSNGILCVLISHSSIDKAAAALDVSIGSLAEPNNVPGIAHFLEHMLFMGSSKYPGENDYQKLIEGNGGFSNAFTAQDHTNYHFDIHPNLLPDALDIFAQFFISPLLAPSSADREVEAVNSEFQGNRFRDEWRILHLDKFTCDPEHPFSQFSCGNKESLITIPKQCGIDIGKLLLNFYKTEYSSNRMSLAVLSNQPLDELQSLVVKSFKDVPNNNLPSQKYPPDPYGEKNRKTICYAVPVNDTRSLAINWVVPDYTEFYYCNPATYIGGLIGHEGEGSLLSHLKKLGLVSTIVACEENGSPGFNFFTLKFGLTIEGLNRWEEIIYNMYQYLAMLHKEGPKEWVFNELKNLNAMNFQFCEKPDAIDYVSNIAGQLRNYPLNECLSGPFEMREFRPDLICQMLDEYLLPNKMRIFLISKTFSTIAKDKEKWFGVHYKQEYLPEEFFTKCETCEINPELRLPSPNDFIPTDFQLYSNQDEYAMCPQLPTKIKEDEFCRLYYAEDSFYKLPKAFIYLEFRNPISCVNPLYMNMNAIYVSLINDSLTEFVYPATLGGLDYEFSPLFYGVQLTINGYNHKIGIFLEKIIDRMINIKIDSQQFEIIKDNVKQSLQNLRRNVPYEMANTGLSYLTSEGQWIADELLGCIDAITVHNIEVFIPQLFTHFHIDSLMYGNLTKDQSIEYMTRIQKQFQEKHLYKSLFPSLWFNHRELCLPEGCNYAYKMLNDAFHVNAIEIYFQCFQQKLEDESVLELFCHLVNEPCFDQLRTKEQLGYVVSSGVRCTRNIIGFRVIVQSSHELDYVNQRIELFIHSIRNYIDIMTDDVFHKLREGYIGKKMEIPKTMNNQGSLFWYEITSHQFCFDRDRLEVEIMKRLERKDLLRFYDHYISPYSPHRRKLALHVNPSPIALKKSFDDEDLGNDIDELPGKTDKELPLPVTQGDIKSEVSSATTQPTEQPPSIDPEIKEDVKDLQKTFEVDDKKYEELNLPKIEWIDNHHIWKSKLPCYPLAQSYEKIEVPVLYKL